MMRLHVNWIAHIACNFNCHIELIETRGLFKVTGIHVHCKSGNISQTVQDTDVVTNMDHQFECTKPT